MSNSFKQDGGNFDSYLSKEGGSGSIDKSSDLVGKFPENQRNLFEDMYKVQDIILGEVTYILIHYFRVAHQWSKNAGPSLERNWQSKSSRLLMRSTDPLWPKSFSCWEIYPNRISLKCKGYTITHLPRHCTLSWNWHKANLCLTLPLKKRKKINYQSP